MNMSSYSNTDTSTCSAGIEGLAELLKVVAEPTRLQILTVLYARGSHCVSECRCHVPDVSQSLLSHHIADLRKAGLIEAHKQGLKVYYSLTSRGQHVMATVTQLTEGETTMNGCPCQACACPNCAC